MADVLPNESEIEAGSPSKGDIPEKARAIDDMEDPDTQRDMQRPANIRFDMKEMERNKRVSLILNSQAFREELEAIIDSQLKVIFKSFSDINKAINEDKLIYLNCPPPKKKKHVHVALSILLDFLSEYPWEM